MGSKVILVSSGPAVSDMVWLNKFFPTIIATRNNTCRIVYGTAVAKESRVLLTDVQIEYIIDFQFIACEIDFATVYNVICNLLSLVA